MYPRIQTCCDCLTAMIMDDKKYHTTGVICPGCGTVYTSKNTEVCITSHR